jgi:acetolactate decarboxylase
MATLNCDVPSSLMGDLTRAATGGESLSHIVTAALSQYLNKPIHTLFQVSTSGALVAGIYSGAVSSGLILQHGDFGLGAFENLDGEMVILDGRVYRVQGNGVVSDAPADTTAPFAVVTRFAPEVDLEITPAESLKILSASCDAYRPSNNIFYAFRLDGQFHQVRTRAMNPPKGSHNRLVDLAQDQSEFEFSEIAGTLVGLWSPGFSSAFSFPGYHFHFLSDDRRHGGHLLECSTGTLRLRREELTDFHLALPESELFLKADLSKNGSGELAYVEEAH